MKINTLWVSIGLLLALWHPSNAQTGNSCSMLCCGKDIAPAGAMYTHTHAKGEWMVSYRYQFQAMAGIWDRNSPLDNQKVFEKYLMSPTYMRMQMHMGMVMYGLSDRVTLMGMFHLMDMHMDMAMLDGGTHIHNGVPMSNNAMDHSMKTFGLGDSQLSALVSLLKWNSSEWMAFGGFNLPTGNIYVAGNANSMYPNSRFPYAMQLGTGTWDILTGSSLLTSMEKFSYGAQISAVWRWQDNALGYRWGNQYQLGHWLGYLVHPRWSITVRNDNQLLAPMTGYDPTVYAYNEPAANPQNYGGFKSLVFLGFSHHVDKGILSGLKLGLEAGIPIYQYYQGYQMPTRWNLGAQLSYAF